MADDISTGGLDIAAAADTLGHDLFPSAPDSSQESVEDPEPEVSPHQASAPTEPAVEPPTVPDDIPVPKAWPKDMHGHWAKVPKEVREYLANVREKQMLDGLEQYKAEAQFGKMLREAINPYNHLLQQHRLEPHVAVQHLLGAHARLTTGTMEQRKAAYEELGRNLKIISDAQQAQAGTAPQVDPALQPVLEKVSALERDLEARKEADRQAAYAKASKEVEAFAADTTAHPYFDECSDHIVKLIQAGYPLQEAYDTAVLANPVTRAKEVARIQTEHEAKLKENARLESLPKKRATNLNVKSRDTKRAPTEPLGTMEDTLKSTLNEIRSRAHSS